MKFLAKLEILMYNTGISFINTWHEEYVMNINQIQYALTVARYKNFSKAAESLSLSANQEIGTGIGIFFVFPKSTGRVHHPGRRNLLS